MGLVPPASALPPAANTTRNLQKLHTDSTLHNGFSTIYLQGGCKADAREPHRIAAVYPFCSPHVPVLYSPCSPDVTFL